MHYINNLNELNNIIWENKDSLILLYFGAKWCGPCKKLKERLDNNDIMLNFENLCVIYLDADIEELQELFSSYNINGIPCQVFTMLNDENQVIELDRFVGYNWEKFITIYTKHESK